MSMKKAFTSVCAIGFLAGCGQTPQEAGYVPVSRETVKTLPPQPIEVIYGSRTTRIVLPVGSPLECLDMANALGSTARINISNEPSDSMGRATCLGSTGVVMMVKEGQAYVPRTLAPKAR